VSRRVLFVCHDAGGTIPPVLAVSEALLDEGHDVTILSQPSVRARAERLGAGFTAFASLPDYDRRRSLEEQLERTLPALTGVELGEDLLASAEGTGAELVVVDPNLAGALAAAEAMATPSAVLLHSLYRTYVDLWLGAMWPIFGDTVNRTRRAFGLDVVDGWAALFDGHDAVLAPSPASFDDAADRGRQQHHGFLVPRPAAEDTEPRASYPAGDGPAVLVGLSTTYQHHEPLLGAIVEALGALPVRALVTTGDHVGLDPAQVVPPNVALVEHADHGALIGATDLVVTHGGLGTIARALSAGVPLVCAPIDRDQPLNAERVRALGAGVVVTDPSPATIQGAVEAVLADRGLYRAAAAAVAEEHRSGGGAASASAALIELCDARN
jgi:UDP:flavonoid glycosyltransferase YjiC (YdhE family)